MSDLNTFCSIVSFSFLDSIIEPISQVHFCLTLWKIIEMQWFHKLQPHTVRLDHHTLKLLKYWTWQFVIIRPVCTILMIALQIFGMYPSWLSWTFTIILNISVSLALYSLVLFYHVFAKELQPHKPLAKFMCIKGIVFVCFWQVNFILCYLLLFLCVLCCLCLCFQATSSSLIEAVLTLNKDFLPIQKKFSSHSFFGI